MQWDANISANGQQTYSNTENLTSAVSSFPGFALCLPNYAKLDGNYKNVSGSIQKGANGYISAQMSGADCTFSENPQISIQYAKKHTSNGMEFTFNPLSGDYASKILVIWTLAGSEVDRHVFEPDGVNYYAEHKVGQHDALTIEFQETSKPYRYVWINGIINHKLTRAGGLEIVYEDVAVGAKEDFTPSSSTAASYVDLNDLKGEGKVPNVAFCYPKYSKLSSDFKTVDESPSHVGFVSKTASTIARTFQANPTITFRFGAHYSSIGVSLTFNELTGDYCSELSIRWYDGSELLSVQIFEPTGTHYFCYNPVENYDRILIQFTKTSKPYRPVFLTNIDFGLHRVFRSDEVKDVDCISEISPISEELTINTLNFAIRSKSDYMFDFQERQLVKLYFDKAVIGNYYLVKGNRTSQTDYYFETQDALGLLDSVIFFGDIYKNKKMTDLISEIFSGEQIAYYLDDAFATDTVSGYIPICTKREALQQVAFATGAIVDTSFDDVVHIYKSKDVTADSFDESDIFAGTMSVEYSDIVTGVRLSVHDYTESSEVEELYNGVLDGYTEVRFSEPHHSLTITGGVIMSRGTNRAIIHGSGGTVVLNGKKYNHSVFVQIKDRETPVRYPHQVTIEDATLVTSANAQAVLNRVFDYYTDNVSVSFKGLLDEREMGWDVTVPVDYIGDKHGVINKMDFIFTNEVAAEVTVK